MELIAENHYPKCRWLVLFVASFAVATVYIHMTAIAPILGTIANDINVDVGLAGQLLTTRMFAEALFCAIGGIVCDRYGLPKALFFGHILAFISVILTPIFGDSFWGFMSLRFIQGIGVGVIFPVIGYIAAHWFPVRQHGMANGLFFGAPSIGAGIGAWLSPTLQPFIGNWQWTVACLGIFNLIGILCTIFIVRKEPPQIFDTGQFEPKVPSEKMAFFQAIKHPISLIGTFIVGANAIALMCLYNFMPAFLAEPVPLGIGLGAIVSGRMSLLLTWIGIFAVLFGGYSYDVLMKGRAKLLVAIGFVMSGTVSLLLLQGVNSSFLFIGIILLVSGFGIPFQNAALSSYIVNTYPDEVSGSMLGWWYGSGGLCAAAGLYIGSLSVEITNSFNYAIGMISISCVMGLMLSIIFLKHGLRVCK